MCPQTSRGARVSKRVLNTEGEGAGSGLGSRKLFFKNRNFRTVTVAARHDSIVLDCEAAGSPVPTIHWLKDGERIVQVCSWISTGVQVCVCVLVISQISGKQ